MLVSWYLPNIEFPLWPCAVLLVVFIPISILHDRNWRKTLADYARLRREAGAPEGDWPSASLARLMSIQPGLIIAVCAVLGIGVAIATTAALMWPQTPPGFDLPINPLDLPYLWSMIVAGTAAIVAGVAIAVDVLRSPWSKVAKHVRRAMYAPPVVRAKLFADALKLDPELQPGFVAPSSAQPTAVPPESDQPSAPDDDSVSAR